MGLYLVNDLLCASSGKKSREGGLSVLIDNVLSGHAGFYKDGLSIKIRLRIYLWTCSSKHTRASFTHARTHARASNSNVRAYPHGKFGLLFSDLSYAIL